MVVALVLVLSACGSAGPSSTEPPAQSCSERSAQFIDDVEALLDDWDDANALASSTSRIALGTVKSQLQSIRRDVSDIEAPICATNVKKALVDFMDNQIDGYLAFMAQEDDDEISSYFTKASRDMDIFMLNFGKLKAGEAPFD